MKQAYFLTGTDTGIGKTFITCALLRRARQLGFAAAGLKPVASGTDAAGRNEDVEAIRAASGVELAREIVNPYCFAAAIAPHLAAAEAGSAIRFAPIIAACQEARQIADFVVVEGVGGFRVPLGADGDSADLAVALGLPLILVVGMRLGCINHALLTAEAIAARGLRLAGWVANRIDPAMARFDANLQTLENLLPAPLLGVVPHAPDDGGGASLNLPEVRRGE
ncbi:MAG: dethiobiotin synthase [Betaproteobacteria bacterium]|nr:dethiobiotin synthase [Betaproteobacteria bacterium]MCL2885892.1 dethiobiotin synthase [Betaproteobacteria bacterium]